jgi:hypothetical protein
MGVPQCKQKFASSWFSCPQEEQSLTGGAYAGVKASLGFKAVV